MLLISPLSVLLFLKVETNRTYITTNIGSAFPIIAISLYPLNRYPIFSNYVINACIKFKVLKP